MCILLIALALLLLLKPAARVQVIYIYYGDKMIILQESGDLFPRDIFEVFYLLKKYFLFTLLLIYQEVENLLIYVRQF